MRLCVLVFVIVGILWPGHTAPTQTTTDSAILCPPGEYHPGGPGCGLEPSCPPRGFHTATWHASTECSCWCNPGLYRDSDTKLCVPNCS